MKKNPIPKEISFTLTEAETARAFAFCNIHQNHSKHMAAGDAFVFKFMPTMLGDFVYLTCLTCGVTENITDYDKF